MVGKREISEDIIFVAFDGRQSVMGVSPKRVTSSIFGRGTSCEKFILAGQIETDITGVVSDSKVYTENDSENVVVTFHARAAAGYSRLKERVYLLTPLKISKYFNVPENRGLMRLLVLKAIYDDFIRERGAPDSNFVKTVAKISEAGKDMAKIVRLKGNEMEEFESLFRGYWGGIRETRQAIFLENMDLSDIREDLFKNENLETSASEAIKAEVLRFVAFLGASKFLLPESEGKEIKGAKNITLKTVTSSGSSRVVAYEKYSVVDGITLLRHIFQHMIIPGILESKSRLKKKFFKTVPSFLNRKMSFNSPHFRHGFYEEFETVLITLLNVYSENTALYDFLRRINDEKIEHLQQPLNKKRDVPDEEEEELEIEQNQPFDFEDFIEGEISL